VAAKSLAEEIDGSSLAMVLAKNRCAFLILERQMMIDMGYRADHLFPAKLVCENLRERSGM
jgi:hypothetical protein